jgi:methylenetetrahydrofolate dehydrogenase (NADP+) / methenyltetrahydrofolate cyclohydrolase
MPARILSGKEISHSIKSEVANEVAELRKVHGFTPCLALLRVGEDAASEVYVGSKIRTAEELGIKSEHIHFPADATQEEIMDAVRKLNDRGDVDGILVQLPLPTHINEREIIESIDPEKDVDGFHPINAGKLSQGFPSLAPCTPAGVIEILKRSDIEITGKHAVIVGRSNIVGKPMAAMLLNESATVTVCHSRTRDLASITQHADILIAAVGRAGFIRAEHIAKGATVIDVGINKLANAETAREYFEGDEFERRLKAINKRGFTLVGDVHPKDAIHKAANFTPVPGGVGLLTVAMLMKNTVEAAKMRRLNLNEL